jgi:Domain of unknown function (DUF397)
VADADRHPDDLAHGHFALSGPVWRKSSLSTHAGNCVEVAHLPQGGVGVRDSKDTGPGRVVLAFARPAWDGFLAEVKSGEFGLR